MPKIKVRRSRSKRALMQHQIAAMQYAKPKKRIALFMEMRLGKSLVTVRWADYHNLNRILIVGPLSTLVSWQEELRLEGKKTTFLLGTKQQRLNKVYMQDIDGYYLISYGGLRSMPDILVDADWQAVIVDESTYIKNPKADITRILCQDASAIPYKAILSGLPAPEGPLDLFCQFQFLYGRFMRCSNYWQFTHKHFETVGYDKVPKKGVLTALKDDLHNSAFILSRKQAGIGNKKIFEMRHAYMSAAQKKAYGAMLKDFEYENISTKYITVQLCYLLQITGGYLPDGTNLNSSKLKVMLELLTNELKNEQVVVWFSFIKELEAARDVLRAANQSCFTVSGATSPARRAEITADFKKGSCRIILCQQKVGKFSFDWSAASTAVYYSRNYSVEDRKQSEDRIEHPKKKHPLLYVDLITHNTVDAQALRQLKNKSSNAKLLLRKAADLWRKSTR